MDFLPWDDGSTTYEKKVKLNVCWVKLDLKCNKIFDNLISFRTEYCNNVRQRDCERISASAVYWFTNTCRFFEWEAYSPRENQVKVVNNRKWNECRLWSYSYFWTNLFFKWLSLLFASQSHFSEHGCRKPKTVLLTFEAFISVSVRAT